MRWDREQEEMSRQRKADPPRKGMSTLTRSPSALGMTMAARRVCRPGSACCDEAFTEQDLRLF